MLTSALALLHDGDGWTHNAFARNSDGDTVPVLDETAVVFCIGGAIVRATGVERIGDDFNRANHVICAEMDEPRNSWNDNPKRTFTQVREIFNRAICSAQLREGRTTSTDWGPRSN